MIASAKQPHYVIRSTDGPVLFVYDKELAELLLSKANAKVEQDIKLEIHEWKEKNHRITCN